MEQVNNQENKYLNTQDTANSDLGGGSGSSFYECVFCNKESARYTKRNIGTTNYYGTPETVDELTCEECGYVWCE